MLRNIIWKELLKMQKNVQWANWIHQLRIEIKIGPKFVNCSDFTIR